MADLQEPTQEPTNGAEAEAKEAAPQREVVTGILIYQPDNGPVVGDLTWERASSIKLQRPATFDEMYRLVCDLKCTLESMRGAHVWEMRMKERAMAEKLRSEGPQIIK